MTRPGRLRATGMLLGLIGVSGLLGAAVGTDPTVRGLGLSVGVAFQVAAAVAFGRLAQTESDAGKQLPVYGPRTWIAILALLVVVGLVVVAAVTG